MFVAFVETMLRLSLVYLVRVCDRVTDQSQQAWQRWPGSSGPAFCGLPQGDADFLGFWKFYVSPALLTPPALNWEVTLIH